MPSSLNLEVLTPEKRLLEVQDAEWIKLTLSDGGSIGIQPNHAPLLAETIQGELHYADQSGDHRLDLEAGVLRITRQKVLLMVIDESCLSGSTRDAEPDGVQFDRLLKALFKALQADQTLDHEPNEAG